MWVPLTVVLVGLIMITVELRKPGRAWPQVRGWWARALLVNAMQAGVVYLAGLAWDSWMKEHSLWSLESALSAGPTLAAALGYVVLTFAYYWWHRARHEVPFLWRWFHQFHHSPQRIEILTSFYKHPFELMANGVLSSGVMFLLLGLSPAAAAGATLLSGLAELFYHWNVETPRWVGFVFQRPESHCVHHEEGKHHYNYGDLPIWDILFGTFHNPGRWQGRCGFGEAEHRLGDMLMGRDVNEPEVA